MKKITLLLFACFSLSAIPIHAQYFQHLYGNSSANDMLWDGLNTVLHGQGYFMAGITTNSTTGLNSVVAARTDVDGNIPGGPYFNQQYVITTSAGTPVIADMARVFEAPYGFGIIGRYVDPNIPNPNTGIFYLKLNPAGFPMSVVSYPINDPNRSIVEIGYMDESAVGDFAYVCGAVRNSITGAINHFAMKINETSGNLMWGRVYNFQSPIIESRARDIIESPWMSGDVVMVGMMIDNTSWDGLFTHVNATTGMPQLSTFGTLPNTNDFYQCIAKASSPTAGVGFIVGGGTDMNGNMDFLVSRMDAFGSVGPSSTFDYSWNPTAYNYCNDVIERITPTGSYTYFASGGVIGGFFGGEDALLIKTDDLLVPFAGGEYTYGGIGHDWGGVLDLYNNNAGAAPDGLSHFAQWDALRSTTQQMYLIRSYFNGVSGCNEMANSTANKAGQPGRLIQQPTAISEFHKESMGVSIAASSDLSLCYSRTIPSGSNALVKQAPKGNYNNDNNTRVPDLKNPIHPAYIAERSFVTVQVYPNPAQEQFTIKCDQPVATEVRIFNMLGQSVFEQHITPGNEISVNSKNWSTGMYLIKVYGKDQLLHTEKLIKVE